MAKERYEKWLMREGVKEGAYKRKYKTKNSEKQRENDRQKDVCLCCHKKIWSASEETCLCCIYKCRNNPEGKCPMGKCQYFDGFVTDLSLSSEHNSTYAGRHAPPPKKEKIEITGEGGGSTVCLC